MNSFNRHIIEFWDRKQCFSLFQDLEETEEHCLSSQSMTNRAELKLIATVTNFDVFDF